LGTQQTTPLVWAARAVKENKAGARNMMQFMLSRGAKLADAEVNDWQQYVDSLHAKWSVPAHKRFEDFQLRGMRDEAVECSVCLETISRYTEFVESRLCFHFVCVKCYAQNMRVKEQSCARCMCIKCPQCRRCTQSCVQKV